ncbi:RNA helicase [Streptococcus chenjunshii]|uniref:RNA helicase n=1 Tax=Streptococcus chenjunshii TaxID=2173853 RepID=A0A372KMX1_9STRE|nr:DEAD/DEAH box helicase [Streptococcus chenjunshii]AXQ78101.1 RNA helicase [Streptococcus chenjunshii]RFU51196.1 RNA helicase [Streptococcus chenjunshii]RFU53264.1 RNA helicase [Streptococcus chenjunshii]
MGRMIPGRVRNQGIALYEQGLLKIISHQDRLLEVKVDGFLLQYALEDDYVDCQCSLFAKKQYCEHLAALEYFLKNDTEGKELADLLSSRNEDYQKKKRKLSFGSIFLDGLAINEDVTTKYRLAASASQSPFSSDFWWTLKINRLPDDRAYIVRDIKAFLQLVGKEDYYQIGKNYYEPLSVLQFDDASQELIRFLWRIVPDKAADSTYILPNHGRNLVLPSGFFEEGLNLFKNLYAFSFAVGQQQYTDVTVENLDGSEELYQFEVLVHRHSIELTVKEKNVLSFFDNTYLLYQNTFYRLTMKQAKIVAALKTLPLESDLVKHIHFDLDDQAKLAASLLDFRTLGPVKAPKSFEIRDFSPIFYFSLEENQNLHLSLVFDYGKLKVASKKELGELPFASNFKREQRVFKLLEANGFTKGFSSYRKPLQTEELYQFFSQTLTEFTALGNVFLADELEALRFSEKPQLAVSASGSLLDISFDFSTVLENDIDTATAALLSHQPYFVSQSGQLVIFDEQTQKISADINKFKPKQLKNGHLQLPALSAFQLSDVLQAQNNVSLKQSFTELIQDLRQPENFELPDFKVKAELRDYQLTGVRWLSMLDKYGFGGVLADDMGLGKTLQTIAFLSSRLDRGQRVLILSPSSLIYNWQDEFKKFAPDLDFAVIYGLKPVRDDLLKEDHQIVITSYSSFRQDFANYNQLHFDYLILDEAQVMKNTQTKIAQYLRSFEVNNCFALSGTPIENRLLEIWSIFQIVLPGLLPEKKAFLKLSAEEVARYIKPFIMRRKKEDVLPELPELLEINYHNELADSQKAIYLAQLRQMQDNIRGSSDADINRKKIEILSGITRLRQICDSPSLFTDYDGGSGKLDSLRDLLLQIKESGHRALVFSQFRGMLDIAERELQHLGLTAYKMTGSTPAAERQAMTRAFNSGAKDIFLISLKAGGIGLNLTGADTVVLIDLWWNPAVEMQAISRAHRIGQDKSVDVYRLITRGTIEEKILELQERKRHLVTTVLDGNETRASMSVEDIKEILGLND